MRLIVPWNLRRIFVQDKTELTIVSYNKNAEFFEEKFMDLRLYKDSFEVFRKQLHPNSSILDLGCGPGNVAKYLLDEDPSLSVLGIDLSTEMIRLANKNVLQANFKVGDIRQLDIEELSFDAIVAAFCLPFLYDEEAKCFIHNIGKIVRAGGLIYLSTMKGEGFQFEVPSFSKGDEMFFNYFSREFLEEEFRRNDLDTVDYVEQNYNKASGTFLVDMIYILKKRTAVSA
jgi:SAM-dependent methyltransferase